MERAAHRVATGAVPVSHIEGREGRRSPDRGPVSGNDVTEAGTSDRDSRTRKRPGRRGPGGRDSPGVEGAADTLAPRRVTPAHIQGHDGSSPGDRRPVSGQDVTVDRSRTGDSPGVNGTVD